MNLIHNCIDVLAKYAQKSNMINKHCASIITSKHLIISGINKYHKDSSIHAENNVLWKYKTKKNMDMCVIRINKHGKLIYSRPCKSCIDILKKNILEKYIIVMQMAKLYMNM